LEIEERSFVLGVQGREHERRCTPAGGGGAGRDRRCRGGRRGACDAVVTPAATTKSGLAAKNASSLDRVRERLRENDDEGDAASEDYESRAYPAAAISFDQKREAMTAAWAVAARGSDLTSKWSSLGPTTLDVDRLGTQTYLRPTQWSGRLTAMAIDPKCKPQECALYIGAAGGGVWRTKNALAPNPQWKFSSDGIPSNAIGSIGVDPNDPTGKTIYVGTGEANASGDSEAGIGLYRTSDDGVHWEAVAGSVAVAANRGIAWIAIDPTNASHIFIGTRAAVRGPASNGGSTTPPGAPAVGIYESKDAGTTFTLSRAARSTR